jgi:hypothetical protein
VLSERVSPAALTHSSNGAETLLGYVRQAAAAIHFRWSESNALVLRRGPYIVASGLDDTAPGAKTRVLRGNFVNLFDANLPIVHNVELKPDARLLLVDLNRMRSAGAQVVAASCRISNESADGNGLAFDADGIANTQAVVRIKTGRKPGKILIDGKEAPPGSYETAPGTLLLRFPNSVDPVRVTIGFAS